MVVKISVLFVVLSTLALHVLGGSVQREGRIVGGSFAREAQFPWQAALVEESGDYICNGFIINQFWIGTSAFCVYEYVSERIEAIVGTTSWKNGGDRYRISEIVIHESFIPSVHLNDVATLRTQQEIAFNDKTRPGVLGAILVNPGATVTQSSFGKTSHLQELVSEALMYVDLQVITKPDCQSRLTALGHNAGVVFDSNFCTFNRIGQGSCHGDAGSPIVMSNQIVGFNTWDSFCAL